MRGDAAPAIQSNNPVITTSSHPWLQWRLIEQKFYLNNGFWYSTVEFLVLIQGVQDHRISNMYWPYSLWKRFVKWNKMVIKPCCLLDKTAKIFWNQKDGNAIRVNNFLGFASYMKNLLKCCFHVRSQIIIMIYLIQHAISDRPSVLPTLWIKYILFSITFLTGRLK